MRGVYEIVGVASGVTTADDLMSIEVLPSFVGDVLYVSITNSSQTTSEQFEACVQRITPAFMSGTVLTPVLTQKGDKSSDFTGRILPSGGYTLTADTQLGREGANNLGGWRYQPTVDERMTIEPGGGIVVRTLTDLANSSDLTVRAVLGEHG